MNYGIDELQKLAAILSEVTKDIETITKAPAIPLGNASPPSTSGVYLLLVDENVSYVGEAKGSGGLRDRLLNKHISGDDNHAVQRAFLQEFPDRQLRRKHIKENVLAKWVEIADHKRISAVERVLICLYCPPWNKA